MSRGFRGTLGTWRLQGQLGVWGHQGLGDMGDVGTLGTLAWQLCHGRGVTQAQGSLSPQHPWVLPGDIAGQWVSPAGTLMTQVAPQGPMWAGVTLGTSSCHCHGSCAAVVLLVSLLVPSPAPCPLLSQGQTQDLALTLYSPGPGCRVGMAQGQGCHGGRDGTRTGMARGWVAQGWGWLKDRDVTGTGMAHGWGWHMDGGGTGMGGDRGVMVTGTARHWQGCHSHHKPSATAVPMATSSLPAAEELLEERRLTALGQDLHLGTSTGTG